MNNIAMEFWQIKGRLEELNWTGGIGGFGAGGRLRFAVAAAAAAVAAVVAAAASSSSVTFLCNLRSVSLQLKELLNGKR